MTEQNDVLFDLLTELWNTGNLELLPQIFGEEAERNDPNFPQPLRGREQIGRSIREVHASFPDFELQIKHRICESDQVATEWTCSGTHTGVFQGIPPTGKRVTIIGISLNRIRDNKIVEERAYFDRLALLQQLGVVSGSAQNQGIAAAHT
jgi:steroid delta-isomerase-like uncharacterized protein